MTSAWYCQGDLSLAPSQRATPVWRPQLQVDASDYSESTGNRAVPYSHLPLLVTRQTVYVTLERVAEARGRPGANELERVHITCCRVSITEVDPVHKTVHIFRGFGTARSNNFYNFVVEKRSPAKFAAQCFLLCE